MGCNGSLVLAGYRVITFWLPFGYPKSFQNTATGPRAGHILPDFYVSV